MVFLELVDDLRNQQHACSDGPADTVGTLNVSLPRSGAKRSRCSTRLGTLWGSSQNRIPFSPFFANPQLGHTELARESRANAKCAQLDFRQSFQSTQPILRLAKEAVLVRSYPKGHAYTHAEHRKSTRHENT